MAAGTPVLIFGACHPHIGATGTLTDDFVQPHGGPKMIRVELDRADLGADACYVEAADLMPVTHSYAGGED